MTEMYAVVVSWQSEMMPVPAHFAYHEEHVPSDLHLPQMTVREVPTTDLAHHVVCCDCWQKIHQEQEEQRS
jgi:hypothetical protein